MSDNDIKQLKEEEQNKLESLNAAPKQTERTEQSASSDDKPGLFGPILLIGIGVYFLLANLNLIDGNLHWDVLFNWWPLLFIFIGLNIIVKQLPGALGTLATGLVGFTAVGVAGTLLIFGNQAPVLGQLTPPPAEIQHTEVNIPLERGVDEVNMSIDFNSAPAQIDVLRDSNALVRGDIYTTGGADIDVNRRGDNVTIEPDNEFQFGFTAANYTSMHEWELGLSPDVLLDLELDLSSGANRFDLSGLQLNDLRVDGSSGATTITLPDSGDYDMSYDVGSGAVWMTMPARGQHQFAIDGGSGGLNIILPAQIEARVTVDPASGMFTISEQFRQSDGRGKDIVYTTPNFDENGANYIDLELKMGSGSVSISPEAGE